MSTNDPVPQTLYHYCSVEAFLQIIETKSIRLSSVLGFNDYLETKWIEPLIEAAIEPKKTAKNELFFDTVMQHYHDNQTIPFMTCFSSDGDTLSQWRAYAADGYGFAIGLNPKYFPLERQAPYLRDDEHAIGISEVVYNQEAQHDLVKKVIDTHLADCCEGDNALMVHHAVECATVLLRYSLIFKNTKFNEEMEWRIIYVPTITTNDGKDIQIGLEQRLISDLMFRYTEQAIIPHFDLPFFESRDEEPINEIVLGPKNTTETFVVRMLLDKYGLGNVNVIKSEASYR
jgi:hypothetical protein